MLKVDLCPLGDKQVTEATINLRKLYNIKAPDAIIAASALTLDETLPIKDIQPSKINGLRHYKSLRKFLCAAIRRDS